MVLYLADFGVHLLEQFLLHTLVVRQHVAEESQDRAGSFVSRQQEGHALGDDLSLAEGMASILHFGKQHLLH